MSSLGLNLGITITLPGGTASTPSTPTTTTPSTTTPSTGTTTPTTPAAPVPVPPGTTARSWQLKAGETIYRNPRDCTGPIAWSQWLVACVFPDGQAVLVGAGNQVMTTMGLIPGYHLRRLGEVYPDDPYPGP